MKPCPFCAEQIQDAAIKCRHCGSMLTEASPLLAAGNAAGAAPAGVAASSPQPAAQIYRGRPSWKAQFNGVIASVALCLAGLAAAPVLRLSFDQPWGRALVAAAVILGVGALWFLYLWLARISIEFRITERSIDVESGLLSKSIETVQLWKVRDIEFYQSLSDRMLGVVRVRVFTQDVTTPQFMLWGLPGSREVFEKLKNAIEIARQARNVIGMVE